MTELLANRDEECSKLRDELRNNKNLLEDEKRSIKGKVLKIFEGINLSFPKSSFFFIYFQRFSAVEHSKNEAKMKYDNHIEIIKSEFTREMNQLKVLFHTINENC